MGLVVTFLEVANKEHHLTRVIRGLNHWLRKISFYSHKLQFFIEWRLTNNPEHFDHQIDLHYLWHQTQKSYPMERGVFSNFSLLSQQGKGHTLDLCCGDGFFAYYFYSLSSETVTAIDFDPLAIDYAKLNYRRDNIKFILGDVRTEIPAGPFSNIIWDAAIEHFTESEIVNLMNKIKSVLAPQGILSGYTIQERHSHQKSLHQHEYEFADRDDLVRFLKPFFTNVHVIQTVYPDRTNFYFFATDGILPFDAYLNQTKITKY